MNYLPRVTIGLVLHKGEKYLKSCITSLMDQDYQNIEFVFRDQSPNGEVYEFIKRELFSEFRRIKLEKGPNLWHSGGHNSLIRRMNGDYYVVASQDMSYPRDFISSIVKILEKPANRHYGSATCKLMKWDFDNMERTDIIDSCGIGLTKSHHFYDIGQGELDKGQFDHIKEIFGASGALAIYRKSALDDIRYKNDSGKYEYFDSLLHHKNDVDISYRLQWSGHRCLFMPYVRVWHDRQVTNTHKSPSLTGKIVKARKDKPQWVKEDSFFGQQIVLKKNFNPEFSTSVHLHNFGHKTMTYCYSLLFEPSLLKQFKNIKEFEEEIRKKKKAIKFRIPPSHIEQLMT